MKKKSVMLTSCKDGPKCDIQRAQSLLVKGTVPQKTYRFEG